MRSIANNTVATCFDVCYNVRRATDSYNQRRGAREEQWGHAGLTLILTVP